MNKHESHADVKFFSVLSVFFLCSLLVSCSKDNDALPPPPAVTSFVPVYGLPGASITITGNNFSVTPAGNIVTINGSAAEVTSATTKQLTVVVPVNATTGKITVTVSDQTATASDDFEVLKDIPRAGLIAFYPFTGNGNCVNDQTLNFNFSLAGAPSLVKDRHNRGAQALSFNGTSQYAEILKEVIPGQPWTISFWMDPGTLTLFDHEIMTSYFSNTGYAISLRVDNNDASKYYVSTFHVGPAGTTYLSPTTSYLPAADTGDNWISIIMTFDGATHKVYKDGIEIIANAITPAIPLMAGQRFGIGGDAAKYFTGKLDDIVIYNRVLDASEITQLFGQSASKY